MGRAQVWRAPARCANMICEETAGITPMPHDVECPQDCLGSDSASGDAEAPAGSTCWGDMEKASDIVERGPSTEALSTTESARLGFRRSTPMAISSGLFGI